MIREHLGVQPYAAAALRSALQAMRDAAHTKDEPADLINVAIEELIRERWELPAFNTLRRAARRVARGSRLPPAGRSGTCTSRTCSRNITSAYGGYGGIGYYHVSDKYIALFSRFRFVRGVGGRLPVRRPGGEQKRDST